MLDDKNNSSIEEKELTTKNTELAETPNSKSTNEEIKSSSESASELSQNKSKETEEADSSTKIVVDEVTKNDTVEVETVEAQVEGEKSTDKVDVAEESEIKSLDTVNEKESKEEKIEVELPESKVSADENNVKESGAVQKAENKSAKKAIDEIEDKIAEHAENETHEKVEMIDYSKFSLEELVAELSTLVKDKNVQSIYNNVNKIKNVFNLKFGELLKSEKDKFLAAGGNSIDFHYSNPIKSTYNSILYDYKIKRNEFFASQDKKLKENLQDKLELIEDLKHLIENAEGATMYKMFKNIQTKWREIGPIPRAKYNDVWRTYHHHVERFYDLLHLSNDLRDLDFKHNLEEKLKLVSRAEDLANVEDINVAFKELQVLHKLWKEEVGPIARNQREEVWERFSEATKKVHDRRHEYFRGLRSKYEENIEKKLAVIKEIEEVDVSENKTRSDWQNSIKVVEGLRDKFFKIGNVPRSKSDEIWAKFKEATRSFNHSKNRYFKSIKRDHLENLNKKKALIEQAVALKDSEDWDNATKVMKKIQADWKTIGHVPRKYSDKLWKEFKDACNHYFNRLHSKQDEGNKEQLEVFNKKKDLLNEIKGTIEEIETIDLQQIEAFIKAWRNLGRVPFEMRHIELKFNKLLDKVVESSTLEKKDVEMLKFQNLVNGYLDQKNYRKLDSEQLFIRKKIDETIREIQQRENNLGFISNVDDSNPLVKNVHKQVNEFKEKLEIWKSKLNYLKNLE